MRALKRKKVGKSLRKTVKRGLGLVDKLIDKLPFELHLPNYNYCGPGMLFFYVKSLGEIKKLMSFLKIYRDQIEREVETW